jgi:hypothetical protein
MAKEKNHQDVTNCPVGRFFSEMEKTFGRKSNFFDHLQQSRIEFLKAIRSLLDERIEGLEKKKEGGIKRATKIEVE